MKLGLAEREDKVAISPWMLAVTPGVDLLGGMRTVCLLSLLLQVWLGMSLWLQASVVR